MNNDALSTALESISTSSFALVWGQCAHLAPEHVHLCDTEWSRPETSGLTFQLRL